MFGWVIGLCNSLGHRISSWLPVFETRPSFITFLPDESPSAEELAMGGFISTSKEEPAVTDAVHNVQNRAALRLQFPPISPREYEKSMYELERSDSEMEETKEALASPWDNELRRREKRRLETDDDVCSGNVSSEIHRKHLIHSGRSWNELLSTPFRSLSFSKDRGDVPPVGGKGDKKFEPRITSYISSIDHEERKRIDQESYDIYLLCDAFKLKAAENLVSTEADKVREHSQMYPSVLVGYQICLLFPEDLFSIGGDFPAPEPESEPEPETLEDTDIVHQSRPPSTLLSRSEAEAEADGRPSTKASKAAIVSFDSPVQSSFKVPPSSPPQLAARGRAHAKASLGSVATARQDALMLAQAQQQKPLMRDQLDSEKLASKIQSVDINVATVHERVRVVIGVEKKKDPATGKNSSYYLLLRDDGDVETSQLKRGPKKPGAFFTVLRYVGDYKEYGREVD